MRRLLFLSILALSIASCSPGVMKNITKQLPPLDDNAEVTVYEMGDTIPEHSEVIGGLCISTASPIDWERILEKAKQIARNAGGNGLEVQYRIYPNQDGLGGRLISAFILHVDDNIVPTQPNAFEKEEFNDFVVVKEGDTIPCLVVNETASHLQFIYGYERQGNRKAVSIPKSSLLSYHIEDPAVIKKYREKNRLFKVIVSGNGGYSFSVGSGNSDGSYSSHLSHGMIGFGNVRFNTNNGATLGLHYGYYNLEGTTYFSGLNYSNSGHKVNIHQQFHFIAGSLGINTPIVTKRQQLNCLLDGGCEYQPSMKKHWLYYYLLFGYLSYREDEIYTDGNCVLTGGTLGIGGHCGYDYMLTKHLGIGIGYGFTIGIPFNATGMVLDHVRTRRIMPLQTNFFAGIRYYL